MRANSSGFTLVEILVAVAILAILLALTSQMLSATMGLVDSSVRHMDALTQMTIALNRLDADLRRAVLRSDLKPYVAINAGNDELRFYTTVPAYAGSRNLSVVDYSIGSFSSSSPLALLRSTAGSSWLPGATPAPFAFSASTDASSISIAATDYQTLAPAVFRMELAFVNKADGNLKAQPANADWSDVTGMLVTLAALDSKSRQPLGSNQAALIQSLSALLKDFDGTPVVPVGVYAQWQTIANLQTRVPGMPVSVQDQLRIAQRYYEW